MKISQLKLVAGVVAVGLGQLDDVAPVVARARVGLVDAGVALGAAVRVVGQRDVHLAGHRVDLDVLGAVHLGRAERVARQARADQHVGLRA